jgi:hypothetical protein
MREEPKCPICGEECYIFYVSQYGREIVGCNSCISTESAEERTEEDRLGYLQDKAYDEYKERSWDL